MAKIKIAILISGRGSNMLALADMMSAFTNLAEICLVAADKECAGISHAQERNLPVSVIPYKGRAKADSEAEMIDALQSAKADWIVLAGFMRILLPEFVDAFAGRIINIHPSLLPLYKGLDTHQRALDNGDDSHGATVHLVTAALDDGPVLLQGAIPIHQTDDANSLAARLLPLEHWLYKACISGLITGDLSMTDGQPLWQSAPVDCPPDAELTICPINSL